MSRAKRRIIKEKFKDLYLDRISDFDIEFLYNYIISTKKLKELYPCTTNNTICCSSL